MDSATTLAYAANLHGAENVYTLSFDYGQRHRKELACALLLSEHFKTAEHFVFKLDMTQIGGSALTDNAIPVPVGTEETPKEIPSTYVPMRNTIFLAIAAGYAEVLKCDHIYYGANCIDYGGYPDCRPEYVDAINIAIQRGSKQHPGVCAPYIRSTKKDIILEGEKFRVPWNLTWSCYEGGDKPCGKCNACVQRAKGFREAGVVDPLVEQSKPPEV